MNPCEQVVRRCRPIGRAAVFALLAAAAPATAQVRNPNAAPDLDARGAISRALAERPASATAGQDAALAALRASAPSLRVRWSALTGAPSRIYFERGIDLLSSRAPQAAARAFIERNLALLNLGPDDVRELPLTGDFASANNGIRHLAFQQRVNGMDVFGGRIKVNVSRDGRVLTLSGEPMPNAHGIANADHAELTAEAAAARAAEAAGVRSIRASRSAGLLYFPLAAGELRLSYDVTVEDAATPNMYRTLVDAVDGRILWRKNLTLYSHFNSHGLVFTDEGPIANIPTGIPATVARVDTPFDGRGFFPHDDAHFDWWNGSGEADRNTTRSNNVRAKQDRDGDNDDGEGFFTTSGENFNPGLDLTQDPSNSQNAAITNLFYWNNRLHDTFYRFGFDEAAGNFQSDNFGLGGSGGDPVQADAQDNRDGTPPSMCNANFGTPGDGSSPRMQMFQCNPTTPERDGDLDTAVIVHEFGHGVHSRLVPTSGMQVGNEGWSDFFALSLLGQPGDNIDGNYELGWWLFNGGIRRQPYSTNQSVFTRTYADIVDGAACQLGTCSNSPTTSCGQDADCGAGNSCNFVACAFHTDCDAPPQPVDLGLCAPEVHNTGELWAETLWLMRTNLVRKLGFATGGRTATQLVIDGMKLSPDDPDFLDNRDAILAADLADNAGVNQCLIWNAFARMGMGVSALSGGVNDINPVEGFDTPSTCTPNIQVSAPTAFGDVCPGSFGTLTLEISNNGTGDLQVTSVTRQSGSSDVSVDALPTTPVLVNPGAHLDFTVRCQPSATGLKTAVVRIASSDPDQPQIDLTYTCNAPAAAIATAIADSGSFGDVCVDSIKDLDLTISNTGGCDLQVDSMPISGPGAAHFALPGTTFPLTVSPANSLALPVRFAPTTPGAKTATITVNSRTVHAGTLPPRTVNVSGNAPTGDINVTGSTTFGNVCGGDVSEKVVSVCNTGLCTLHVSSAFLSAPGAPNLPDCADFTIVNNPFPSDVSHDFCMPLTVRFTPSSPGPKSCDLVIVSDDPDEGTVIMTVTATTPAASIDVPADQAFAPEVVQSLGACNTRQPFPISNTGLCPLRITSVAITTNPAEFGLSGLPATPVSLQPGHILGEGDLKTVFEPDSVDRDLLGVLSVTYVSNPVTGDTTTVNRNLCGEGARTGARVLVTAGGVPLASVKKIHLQRIVGNRKESQDVVNDAPLTSVTPALPCTPFQYHREYGAVSNPTGIVPGNYELTVQARVDGRNVSKTIFFDVDTCDFNRNIVVDF
jgi:hypothetical protein